MKNGYYRIKTWEELEEEFGLKHGNINTSAPFVEKMESEMPVNRIIKVANNQWRIGYGSWLITSDMIKERISMKKKDLLNRIEELGKKVSELESEKPVEEERKHLELSVSLDDSKEKSKSIDYAINGGWAYSTFTTTNRDGNFQEKNVMLYLSTSNGTWKNESGSKISGFLSYHPKGE